MNLPNPQTRADRVLFIPEHRVDLAPRTTTVTDDIFTTRVVVHSGFPSTYYFFCCIALLGTGSPQVFLENV